MECALSLELHTEGRALLLTVPLRFSCQPLETQNSHSNILSLCASRHFGPTVHSGYGIAAVVRPICPVKLDITLGMLRALEEDLGPSAIPKP